MSGIATSVFKEPDVANHCVHDKYVVVPADKAHNNIVFVCIQYYIKILQSEVDVENISNKTYLATTLSKELQICATLFWSLYQRR